MVLFIRVLWVPFFTYVLNLFSFIGRHIIRLQEKFISDKRNINLELSEAQKDENIIEDEVEAESLLKFRFQTFEEFVEINQLRNVTRNFSDNLLCDDEKITEDGHENFVEIVEDNFEEMVVENEGKPSRMVGNSLNNIHFFEHGSQFFSDNEDSVSSDSDSMGCNSLSSLRSSFGNSVSDGFLSDIDFERAFEIQILLECCFSDLNQISDFSAKEDIEYQNISKDYGNVDIEDEDEDEDEEILQEVKKLESNLEDKNESLDKNIDLVSEQDKLESNLDDVNDNIGDENGQISEKSSSEEQVCSDCESEKEVEREWEHEDLVEQLKMEIKKVRTIGLPTIFEEECESPKMLGNLKAWKVEEKYEYEGAMEEVQKFYKSYRERMRKLDILNFQKMYATGFLKLKEPLKSFHKKKLSNQAMTAIVSVDCWPCKPKSSRHDIEPSSTSTSTSRMKKYNREIESELEMVYVAQTCLSWEFLCWEYLKALHFWESDPHPLRHYNHVAQKFQTFQILLTRFLEDEPYFQGPRLQHYVQNRCAFPNLLQVPLLRDDNYRNRNKEPKMAVNQKDCITGLQLVEIIEDSIRILWKFIRADTDTSCTVLVNCQPKPNVELQNPADATLLSRVRSTLQKKEKKLKELRNEHCVMRNLHGEEEEGSDAVIYFFSRVDLKLVSRVLNMSRISRDQLVWCSEKLNRIKFVGRKLDVQPSILLFPC